MLSYERELRKRVKKNPILKDPNNSTSSIALFSTSPEWIDFQELIAEEITESSYKGYLWFSESIPESIRDRNYPSAHLSITSQLKEIEKNDLERSTNKIRGILKGKLETRGLEEDIQILRRKWSI